MTGGSSPLSPAGSEARHIATVWWILFALGAAVAIIVLGFVIYAITRKRVVESTSRDNRLIIGGGVVFPAIVLAIIAVVTVSSTAALRKSSPGALVVDITGEQWFWRISYPDSAGTVTTADELRLPVDRPVELRLHADDVAHSFWVPELAGKLDLIPGESPVLRFTPEEIGTFRGECAEFCGVQHANMNLVVDVLSPSDFETWLGDHRGTPPAPTDPLAARGRETFARQTCAGCHTIKGVSSGTIGPDLTDVGGRSTLGAAAVPNTEANLSRWINNAQSIKPGAKMPPLELTPDEINSLVAYLRTLR